MVRDGCQIREQSFKFLHRPESAENLTPYPEEGFRMVAYVPRIPLPFSCALTGMPP